MGLDEVCSGGEGSRDQGSKGEAGPEVDRAPQGDDANVPEPAAEPDGHEVHAATGDQQRRRAPQRHTTEDETARALKLAEGDHRVAAQILGITVTKLKVRISSNPKLRTVWLKAKDLEPLTEDDALSRKKDKSLKPTNQLLAQIIQQEDREMIHTGLLKSGVSQEMIDRLKIFDGFGTNSGNFLIASLDIAHKQMFVQNIELQQQAFNIKKDYLDNATLQSREKIEWQRAFNEIADILGKNYERTLAGVQAMVKMMPKDKVDDVKKKPAFKPLTEADRNAG
jgi:hypothetical protein